MIECKNLNSHRVLSLHFPNATGNAYSISNIPHNHFYVQDIEETRCTTISTGLKTSYRFALDIPNKSKRGSHVATALERTFKVMKPPRKLQTDMGKEFYNFHIKRVLNRYRVHHFSTDQPLKAQIVECFNRTLKETLKQSMAYRKCLDYISMLSDFLYGYNARPHTAFLPFALREVNKSNEAQVHELQYGE